VDRAIDRPDLVKDEFRRGVRLFSEDSVSLPAEFEHLGGSEALVTLKEGKYHQVRRMMAAMGYRVMELHRLSHAGIRVDGIEVNRFRVLALDEVDQLRERLKASMVKRGRKEGQETKEAT
jgi:16S rRNA pseudouridine516 synthase